MPKQKTNSGVQDLLNLPKSELDELKKSFSEQVEKGGVK